MSCYKCAHFSPKNDLKQELYSMSYPEGRAEIEHFVRNMELLKTL